MAADLLATRLCSLFKFVLAAGLYIIYVGCTRIVTTRFPWTIYTSYRTYAFNCDPHRLESSGREGKSYVRDPIDSQPPEEMLYKPRSPLKAFPLTLVCAS